MAKQVIVTRTTTRTKASTKSSTSKATASLPKGPGKVKCPVCGKYTSSKK